MIDKQHPKSMNDVIFQCWLPLVDHAHWYVSWYASLSSQLVTSVWCINETQLPLWEWCSHRMSSLPHPCPHANVNHAWRLCPTGIPDDWQHHAFTHFMLRFSQNWEFLFWSNWPTNARFTERLQKYQKYIFFTGRKVHQMLLSIDRMQNDWHTTRKTMFPAS